MHSTPADRAGEVQPSAPHPLHDPLILHPPGITSATKTVINPHAGSATQAGARGLMLCSCASHKSSPAAYISLLSTTHHHNHIPGMAMACVCRQLPEHATQPHTPCFRATVQLDIAMRISSHQHNPPHRNASIPAQQNSAAALAAQPHAPRHKTATTAPIAVAEPSSQLPVAPSDGLVSHHQQNPSPCIHQHSHCTRRWACCTPCGKSMPQQRAASTAHMHRHREHSISSPPATLAPRPSAQTH